MFLSIAEIEDRRSTTKRTEQPVRRNSFAKGREGIFWKRTNRQEVRQTVLAAKRYDLATRQPGARNGALGHVALEVLEYLGHLIDYRTGRLDPAIETMMQRLQRSRDAIVRALKALRANGFLDWLRRYVPTGNEGRGPRVQQTSNAYRLFTPPRALRLLGRYGQTPPAPDDHTHAQQRHAAEIEAMRATLPRVEAMLFDHEDGPLKDRLASLMRVMDAKAERESAKRSES